MKKLSELPWEQLVYVDDDSEKSAYWAGELMENPQLGKGCIMCVGEEKRVQLEKALFHRMLDMAQDWYELYDGWAEDVFIAIEDADVFSKFIEYMNDVANSFPNYDFGQGVEDDRAVST